MDVKLINGDINVSLSGEYIFIAGIDEVVQRAELCAKIRKGSFVYNKALGTDLGAIDADSALADKTAEMLLAEVLMGTKAKVSVSSLSKAENGDYRAVLLIENGEKKRLTEVTFSADL